MERPAPAAITTQSNASASARVPRRARAWPPRATWKRHRRLHEPPLRAEVASAVHAHAAAAEQRAVRAARAVRGTVERGACVQIPADVAHSAAAAARSAAACLAPRGTWRMSVFACSGGESSSGPRCCSAASRRPLAVAVPAGSRAHDQCCDVLYQCSAMLWHHARIASTPGGRFGSPPGRCGARDGHEDRGKWGEGADSPLRRLRDTLTKSGERSRV